MLKKLVVPLLAHLLLLAAAVWMLLVLLQQSVFTGVLKWVMVGCAALLILCIAAAYLLRVLDYLQQRKKSGESAASPAGLSQSPASNALTRESIGPGPAAFEPSPFKKVGNP